MATPAESGPRLGHLDQHRLEHLAELGLQLGVLEIESDDAAHGGALGSWKGGIEITAVPAQFNCQEQIIPCMNN